MKTKLISLSDIDLSSAEHDMYSLSYGRDLGPLVGSIRKVGLINPVILTGKHNAFTIVCGHQRIQAYQELGIMSIEARMLEEGNDEDFLMLNLQDNLFSRGFNVIEKAVAIRKFLDLGFSQHRLLSEIVPLLGIPSNKKTVEKYLFVLRLDNEIKDSIADQKFDLEKAFLFMSLDNTERAVILKAFFKGSLVNLNELKEVIRNLLDLKEIKQKGIPDLLSSDEICRIMSDAKTNKRQKGEKICGLIKRMRYPAISKKEEDFVETCKEMGLNNNVSINHSRYFEGDEIRITIKSSKVEILKDNLKKLITNANNGVFERIFLKKT